MSYSIIIPPAQTHSMNAFPTKPVAVMRIDNLFSDVSQCHPQHDQDHFKQLTEKIVTKHVNGLPIREWVKTYERNEALDARVYAMGALLIRQVNMQAVAY